jgi:peptidoglycan glycosyltransferase
MNRNIRRLGLFILVMFGVIVADVTYWQVIDASSMAARSDNHRLYDQAQQIRRGRIYDRNGVLLAGRRIGTDGFVHRYYTDPSLSTVIGYDDPRLGKSELESSYDGYLSGTIAGTSWTTFLNRIEHKPVVGNDITLTIDDRIQRAVDGIMPASPSAAIVSDPRTGEILAMVSHPDFDANQVGNTAYWRSLLNDPSFPLLPAGLNLQNRHALRGARCRHLLARFRLFRYRRHRSDHRRRPRLSRHHQQPQRLRRSCGAASDHPRAGAYVQ